MDYNKDTQVCISLAERPGNFGTQFHNFLYQKMGLNFFYKSFGIQNLEDALKGVRALGIRGCALSMPFKEQGLVWVDQLDPHAEKIKAINTIVQEKNGILKGYNTDYLALKKIFQEQKFSKQASVLCFGSGGMARAVLATLASEGFEDVTLVARNEKIGPRLAQEFSRPWFSKIQTSFNLLINASSVGMAPNENESPFELEWIEKAMAVVDCVALPAQTKLIQIAQSLGKETINGFQITVEQALEQFRLYTGQTPPLEYVQEAIHFIQNKR